MFQAGPKKLKGSFELKSVTVVDLVNEEDIKCAFQVSMYSINNQYIHRSVTIVILAAINGTIILVLSLNVKSLQ